jgi:hypothetical protein
LELNSASKLYENRCQGHSFPVAKVRGLINHHSGPQGQKRRTVHSNLDHRTPPGILILGSSERAKRRNLDYRRETFESKILGKVRFGNVPRDKRKGTSTSHDLLTTLMPNYYMGEEREQYLKDRKA